VDLVLALHSHLPYVLHHGRWPHGSDWLCEATLDSYLPLLEVLDRLHVEGVPTPLTIGLTPVLCSQLADPDFPPLLEQYLEQRLAACDAAPAALAESGDRHLVPLVAYWRARLLGLRTLFRRHDGDVVGGFRRHADAGRIELVSSAATHAFLPLLGRDESIRLSLALGRVDHRRTFGREPEGLWLPECAYRPRGPWAPLPDAPRPGIRRGIEEHVADAGYRYCFVDPHLAGAGAAFPGSDWEAEPPPSGSAMSPSPYRAIRISSAQRDGLVLALLRDPVSSAQVWSRHGGYPGDEWYLEFHKIRWPGGLKFWRVSAPGSDLGEKHPYQPDRAVEQAGIHARHFVGLLDTLARTHPDQVIAVPFDTELFGHWWHEGPEFLAQVFRALRGHAVLQSRTAGDHLRGLATPPRARRLAAGSWGAHGDFSMWLNPGTAWTWRRLWQLEARFWDLAPRALTQDRLQPVLDQAARQLLLAMSSDWQFIMTTGAVTDYAVTRFSEHCVQLDTLLDGLLPGAPDNRITAALSRAGELRQVDRLFPEVLAAVAAALAGSGRIRL
jgi:1,4-alpha-glucan branching enzyme